MSRGSASEDKWSSQCHSRRLAPSNDDGKSICVQLFPCDALLLRLVQLPNNRRDEIRSRRAQVTHFQSTRDLVGRDLPATHTVLRCQPKEYPSEKYIDGMKATQTVSHRAELCAEEEAWNPRVFIVTFQAIKRLPKSEICDNVQSRVSLEFCHVDFAFGALANLCVEPCDQDIGVRVDNWGRVFQYSVRESVDKGFFEFGGAFPLQR